MAKTPPKKRDAKSEQRKTEKDSPQWTKITPQQKPPCCGNKQPQKKWWHTNDLPMLVITFFGFLAVVYYACITHQQLGEMKTASGLVSRQLDVIEADQRPWLKAQFEILKPLIFDAKGLQLALSGKTLNVGKLPAFNAELYPVIASNVADAVKTQTEVCEKIRNSRKDRSGTVIFPGDHIINSPITRGFSREEINKGKTMLRFDPPDFKRDLFGIVITGCIVYSLPGHKDSAPHMTGFGYLLRQSKGLGLDTDQGTIPVDEITYFILPELSWAD